MTATNSHNDSSDGGEDRKAQSSRRQTDNSKSERRRHTERSASETRRSSVEKKPSSREEERPKKEGKPKRRISYDEMDIDKLKRPHSNEKEATEKNRSKCDLNLKKERSLPSSSGGDKKSPSRRGALEKKPSSRRLSDEKKDKPSSSSQGNRKQSADKERSSKLSVEKKESQKNNSKPRRPIRRRPSIDDIAIEEFKKKSRRESNETEFRKKSKDDFDLGGGRRKKRTAMDDSMVPCNDRGERGKNANSLLAKSKKIPTNISRSNLEKFETMQSESSKRRGGNKSPEKGRSIDDSESRPKRHSSLKFDQSESQRLFANSSRSDSRRISNDSSESRPKALSRSDSRRTSQDSGDKPKSVSNSLGGNADSRRTSVDSSHAPSTSSGKRSLHKSNHERSISSFGSDGEYHKGKSSSSGHKSSRKPLLRRSSDSERWNKQDTREKPKRLSLDETKKVSSSKVTDSMVVISEGKANRRSSNESGVIPKSLDRDNLEKFVLESPSSKDRHTDESNKSSNDEDVEHGKGSSSRRRNTEKIRRRTKLSNRARSTSMLVRKTTAKPLRRLSSSFSGAWAEVSKHDDGNDSEDDGSADYIKTHRPFSSDRHRSDRELATHKSKRRSHRLTSKKKSRRAPSHGEGSRRKKESSRQTAGESSLLRKSSSNGGGDVEHKTKPGQATSEKNSSLAKNKYTRRSPRSTKKSSSCDSAERKESQVFRPEVRRKRSFWSMHKWKCLCCTTLLLLIAVALVVSFVVLQAFDGGVTLNIGVTNNEDVTAQADATDKPTLSPIVVGTNLPSVSPSAVPTERGTTMAPTPSPLDNVAIAVIVQLDGKPEETGFSLMSADNSMTYISRPIGSFGGQQNEVVMEVISIPERTELVFELTDESGDGVCCTYGNGYYRVFAGTGDQKLTMISGEQSAKYVFTVGEKNALQIEGVDPNEYCKPCPDGKDCGRCAWCNADEGFLPDTVFSWQCHSGAKSIPKQCYIGEKRIQYHNQYVAAMAGCTNGFEAWPQIEASTEATICVEEAKCVKTFAFVEPNCEEELSGSLMVKETCQDKIGGFPFGYSWGINAPREEECPSNGEFATTLAQRCCVDGAAFCDTLFSNDEEEESIYSFKITPPTKAPATHAPTVSHAPSWDGYPITVLIQLDEYPQETGFSITSLIDGKNVTFLERSQGYYKKSQLVVEKVQIPAGIDAILTLTDKEGDGICCENGNGYFQVYSDQGYIILDEDGIFSSSMSKTFFVGDPQTLPPTVSASPTASAAPTFDLYPITIAVNLDRWSDETGFSIQSMDGYSTFFEWPVGSLSEHSSSLFVETVQLPRDIEVNFKVTDTGDDGFCCLYGDGYVKIYAGKLAVDGEDEPGLLAFESADFESEMTMTFRAGPAPSRAPATTPNPNILNPSAVSIGPTASSHPTVDAILMTVVLQLDTFSSETSFFIDSSDGLTNFLARPVGHYEEMKSQKIIETVRLPQGLEYQFRIVDFMGDGTCCWAGNGWYSLYEGEDIEDVSTQVFYGNGDFGKERVHTFIAGKPKTLSPTSSKAPTYNPSAGPTMTPSHSVKPSVTTYPIDVSLTFDSSSSQTGWNIVRDGNVIIDRPPGYFNGSDTLTIAETVRLEAGEYIFTVLDMKGNGFCCKDGVGFYSLYSDGNLLLFRQGAFEYSYNETFSIGPLSIVDNTAAISKSAPILRLRGSAQPSYKLKRQRKHADWEP